MGRILALAALAAGTFALSPGPALAQSCTGNACRHVELKEGIGCAVFRRKSGPDEIAITISIPNIRPGIVARKRTFKPLVPPIGATQQASGKSGTCVKHRDFSYTATKR